MLRKQIKENHGIVDTTQEFEDSPDNFTMRAIEDIPEGGDITLIPLAEMLTEKVTKFGQVRPIVKAYLKKNKKELNFNYDFTFILLEERLNPDSKWKHYIDVLPIEFNNFPLFWTDEEMTWLKGSYLHALINQKRNKFREDYELLCAAVPEFKEEVSLQELMEFHVDYKSRSFGGVPDDGGALVPFADSFNHSDDSNGKWGYSKTRQGFSITARRDVEKGEPISISYGKSKKNSQLLSSYGFVLNANANGRSMPRLKFELDSNDPLKKQKQQLFGKPPSDKDFEVDSNFAMEDMTKMLSYLRVVVYDQKEDDAHDHQQLEKKIVNGWKVVESISKRNELAMIKKLKKAAEDTLT